MNNNFKNAFTLIELLVVIAIIGILSGLIIVGMSSSIQSANIAKAQIFSSSLKDSLLMNLISEWKFDCAGTCVADGATATTAYLQDTWSNNDGGTVYGAPAVRSGSSCLRGSCIDYNGTSDYVLIGNSVTLNLTNGYTVEAWAKHRTINTPSLVLHRRTSDDASWFIFSYRNLGDVANNIYNYVLYTDTTNVTHATTPGAFITPNEWQHLTLTVSNNGVSKYYVNGELKDTRNPTNFLRLGGVTATNTTELHTAFYYNTYYFNGLIDETRIYGATITTSQIELQYYNGLNRLLTNGEVNKDDYSLRLGKLINNVAKNK